MRYVNSAGVCPTKTKSIHVAQSGEKLRLFSPSWRRFATEKTRRGGQGVFPLCVNIPESGKRKMSGRIGKGSLCDPFSLDDGVKGKAGHNILGRYVKMPRTARVAGNSRKRKG
jgi:hypothetical protein